ncbi:hypothetical protein COCOBI_07-0350 [Coccomyxa sp. Obi]|nr:hypothetical protein COCOBI_07-0350 [Coccomyxa sp. Obi]
MDAVRRRFGIFVYDLVEPSVYYDPACPRFKIMDNPGWGTRDQGVDFDKYAEKHLIEVADFFLAVMSTRVLDFFPAFQAGCHKRGKPFAVVRTKTHESVKTLMKMNRVDEITAFRMLKQATYDELQRNGIHNVRLFLVENELWEEAILAYESGDYKNAVTPYDEGKLVRFIAKASLARYSPAESACKFLGELFRRSTSDGDFDHDKDDVPGDNIEMISRTAHDAAQAHATQSTDLPSSQSTECQTDAPNRHSRGPTDSPSVHTCIARPDVPSKLMDVILSKCEAREQLLITGLSKNLREKPVRALILSALEMSRTWPPMTSRDLQWTLVVRHVGLEPVDVKWRLEDRSIGDIVAVRPDCRLPAVNRAHPGMPPHCETLEEFWTHTVTASRRIMDLDKSDEHDCTAPLDCNLELDHIFGSMTDGPAGGVQLEHPGHLFAYEQLNYSAEFYALFHDVGADLQPLGVPLGGNEPDIDVLF